MGLHFNSRARARMASMMASACANVIVLMFFSTNNLDYMPLALQSVQTRTPEFSAMNIRRFVHAMLIAIALPASVDAADYPVKPVRFIVGFAPGGANDLVARVVAAKLTPRLGQQVVVENRSGAGGNIAHEFVAKAAPDGYTMVLASVASMAMSPGLLGKVPFDPVNDFAPVAQLVDVCVLLSVHPSMPVKTLKEFVAHAKRQPGRVNVANPGTGSIAHLSFELFKVTAGIRVVNVPYKGGNPAVIDAISGQVESLAGIISTGAPHVKSGKLRGLGVSSLKRSPSLPEVPSMAEGGYPGFEASGWLGIAFPAKTAAAIVERMHRESAAVMAMPDVREQLQNAGLEPAVKDTEAFRAYIRAELAKWTRLIKDAGIKAD
jgi:tripartite-type tricarboxylate transporter receptor subunit TctC